MLTMEQKDIPIPRWSLGSSSGLHYGSFVNSLSSLTPKTEETEEPAISQRRSYVAIAVLCYINLLNYTERYTIAVFICSFLLLAPLFGYLGDRYNRKHIMIGSLIVWLVAAAGSSFVTESYFWLLTLLRGMVGIGEVGYSTIAPTIIGDLFVGPKRSMIICIFYVFIPVGSGLGYITGAGVTALTGDWRWALRITPILGVVGLFLLVFLCPNPPRGAAETQGEGVSVKSSYLEDIKYLLKNKTYVWSTLGLTATAFLSGALAFWMPTFLSRARVNQGLRPPCVKEPCDSTDSYIFGALTVLTGILGACLGSGLSRWLRDKFPKADSLICAAGLLGAAPSLFLTIFLAPISIPATYVFIFFGGILISMNWAIMADMLLYIVIPTRRATAEALQISVAHLLGDAGSPYLVGVVSEAISKSKPVSAESSFGSLQYSLLLCPVAGIISGLLYSLSSLYIIEDRKAAAQLVEGVPRQQKDPFSEPPIELNNGDKSNHENNLSQNIEG
ncbi:protein spinster homolog 3 isoform X2 [Eleginops maclovinus]|uniref:protein spinster homolog 3 isoform X2 n=1 Tax=Eleginops maclovinus TaxID=56733 RepID=UPI0030800213